MTADNRPTAELLTEIRADLENESSRALLRAKVSIGVRGFLIVLTAVYMAWLLGAVSQLDAPAITRFAASSLEERLPRLRADLRDYAIDMAPDLTDKAVDLMVAVPARVRKTVQAQLLHQTDAMIGMFERELDAAVTGVVETQLEVLEAELPGMSGEEQLDTILFGVSDIFRDTMVAALDEIYEGYSGEIDKLNGYLEHLQREPQLSASEQLDRQLIETWMVLVHRHGVTQFGDMFKDFEVTS